MKLTIGYTPNDDNNEDILVDYDILHDIKLGTENSYVNIDEIKFDVDAESLKRLKMLSYLNEEIDLKDAENNTFVLSGSELAYYIPLIEQRLGQRYLSINYLYNDFKDKIILSGEEFTFNQVLTAFDKIIEDEI
jgi:hypothetical protein